MCDSSTNQYLNWLSSEIGPSICCCSDINGGSGDDVLRGDADNDVLDGGLGSDIIEGGDDDDTIYGREGNDSIEGGLGVDTI